MSENLSLIRVRSTHSTRKSGVHGLGSEDIRAPHHARKNCDNSKEINQPKTIVVILYFLKVIIFLTKRKKKKKYKKDFGPPMQLYYSARPLKFIIELL